MSRLPSEEIFRFTAGEPIFREGDSGDCMYLVLSGQVVITKFLGGIEKEIAVLEKGDFFGEMSLLEGTARSASAWAAEDVKLRRIVGASFERLLRRRPEVAFRMMRSLSKALRRAEGRLEGFLSGFDPAARQALLGQTGAASLPPVYVRFCLDGSDHCWDLRRPEGLLGRKDNVTQIFPDVDLGEHDPAGSVSRSHAKLLHRDGRYWLAEDLAVRQGTRINGKRLEKAVPGPLNHGDLVTLGDVSLRFLEINPAPSP